MVMRTTREYDGLIGEHEPEVAYEARSGCTPAANDADDRALEPEVVARRTPNGQVLINGRFLVDVVLHRYQPPRGRAVWVACATLETSAGPLQWCASVTEQEVARRFAAQHGFVGIDFNQMFRGRSGPANARSVQRGARQSAFQRVVGDVRRTLDTPAAQGILTAASAIPYVGPAVQGLRAATTIVDNVANGDPRARRNLTQLQHAARRGHPGARRAVNVVAQVARNQRRVVTARGRAQSVDGSTRRPAVVERAWRAADVRWNEWRAERAREGTPVDEPIIPPPPARVR
jgi:hypothetical protein